MAAIEKKLDNYSRRREEQFSSSKKHDGEISDAHVIVAVIVLSYL